MASEDPLSDRFPELDHHDLPKELRCVHDGELDYSWSELPGRPR